MVPAPAFKPRFQPGHLVMTPRVNYLVQEGQLDPMKYLQRHVSGDWGDLSEQDRQANEKALLEGERLLSHYQITSTVTLMITTERDRSVTTLLLSDEI